MHKTTDTSRPRAKAYIYLNTHLKSHKFHVNCQLQSKKRQNSLKINILPLVLIKEEKETFSLSSSSSLRENDDDEKDTSREDFREGGKETLRVFVCEERPSVCDLGSSSSSRDEVNRNRTRFGGKIYTHTRARKRSALWF